MAPLYPDVLAAHERAILPIDRHMQMAAVRTVIERFAGSATAAQPTAVAVIKADGTETTYPRCDAYLDAANTLHVYSLDDPTFQPTYLVCAWREAVIWLGCTRQQTLVNSERPVAPWLIEGRV